MGVSLRASCNWLVPASPVCDHYDEQRKLASGREHASGFSFSLRLALTARQNQESSSELHRESWMSVVVTPALSIHPVVPGEQVQILVEPVEGVAFVELSARLVGHSEIAFVKSSLSSHFLSNN